MLASGIFCLLIISMPQMMLYAVEVRMYSWALFFVTASFIYSYEIIHDSSIKNWIIFTILTICSCYTHHFAVLASISIYIILLIPIFKLKIKIGSRIRFKILEPIINAVGVLEFPSACNVSENKLLKIKRYAKTIIGTK